jgi:hypothetical protein
MKSISLIALLFALSNLSQGQESEFVYKGGLSRVSELFYDNFKLPEWAKNAGIEGQTVLKFKCRDGKIDSLQILNRIHLAFDYEVVRVFMLTDGDWLLEEDNFYLFPFKVTSDYPQRIDDRTLLRLRDRQLKREKFDNALQYSDQIRKRRPADVENLDILISIYHQLNKPDSANHIEYLKNQLSKYKNVYDLEQ